MSDSLKQAVEGLEVAWRRLREVLDGPDVAAALVERQACPRHMADAPRDGTFVYLDFGDGRGTPCAHWEYPAAHTGGKQWVDADGTPILQAGRAPVGWWPAPKSEVQPMSTAPRDGTDVVLHFAGGTRVTSCWASYAGGAERWMGAGRCRVAGEPTGWSPVK